MDANSRTLPVSLLDRLKGYRAIQGQTTHREGEGGPEAGLVSSDAVIEFRDSEEHREGLLSRPWSAGS